MEHIVGILVDVMSAMSGCNDVTVPDLIHRVGAVIRQKNVGMLFRNVSVDFREFLGHFERRRKDLLIIFFFNQSTKEDQGTDWIRRGGDTLCLVLEVDGQQWLFVVRLFRALGPGFFGAAGVASRMGCARF